MNQRLKNESANVDQISLLKWTDENETTTDIMVMQMISMLNLALEPMMIDQS